jgi:hypothetical protein
MSSYNCYMNAVDEVRLDRSVFEVGSLDGEDPDKAYWHAKSPRERMEALELLRQIIYGYDPASDRLQRVLEVAELE